MIAAGAVRTLIADLVRAGVSADLVGRVAEELMLGATAGEAVSMAGLSGSDIANMNEADNLAASHVEPAIDAAKPATVSSDVGRALAMVHRMLPKVAGLSRSGAAVASAIVGHYNKDTGRCDPGEARIAGLLHVSVRTVRRAVRELERLGLINVRLHGGHRHTNAYQPNWSRFGELSGQWDAAMTGRANADKRTILVTEPAKVVRQTHIKNPDRESGDRGTRRRPPDPRQREMLMPIAGSGTPKAEAARDAAGVRVWQAVHRHFSQTLDADAYSHIVGSIPEAVWDRSGQAEFERTGSGLRIILNALRLPDPHAGAPPGQVRSG